MSSQTTTHSKTLDMVYIAVFRGIDCDLLLDLNSDGCPLYPADFCNFSPSVYLAENGALSRTCLYITGTYGHSGILQVFRWNRCSGR